MTAKLARHRASADSGAPAARDAARPGSRSASHRGGLPPAVGTTLLAVAVVAALVVVLLGVLR
jgi:hypothetical protein